MSNKQSQAIVIGCGNPSRGDDAIGHRVIGFLETTLRSSSRIVLVKTWQLDITLAEQIASQDLVVFVDAALVGDANQAVRVLPLVAEPSPAPNPNSHALAPAELLALTGWLYGHVPKAMLVAVTGYDFSFGESLSAPAESLIPEATNAVLAILREFDRSFMS